MPENKFGAPSFEDYFKRNIATNYSLEEDGFLPPAEQPESSLDELDEHSLSENLSLGKYENVLEFLSEGKDQDIFFLHEIEKIKQTPELETVEFLSAKDWELLALIEMKDQKTFEHSVGTFLIAKDKIEKKIPQIAEWIKRENISLQQFYRACLFHDIGKLALPDIILGNTTNETAWSIYYTALSIEEKQKINQEYSLEIPEEIQENPIEIVSYFFHKKIVASKFVPLEKALSPEQITAFTEMGINVSLPIGKILETHEEKSETILKELGYGEEARLAGNHHNYKQQHAVENKYPASQTSLVISREFASQIIHLADVQQALQTNRNYHMKKPLLKILSFLSNHAINGRIDPTLTALWIDDEIKKMRNTMPDYFSKLESLDITTLNKNSYVASRINDLREVSAFLLDYLPKPTTGE